MSRAGRRAVEAHCLTEAQISVLIATFGLMTASTATAHDDP